MTKASTPRTAEIEPNYTPFGATAGNGQPPAQPWLTPQDLYLFNEGSHLRLYDKLGAHPVTRDGKAGFHFAVWAPNAEYVSVIGDFNGWHPAANPLEPMGGSGVWGGFVPDVPAGR